MHCGKKTKPVDADPSIPGESARLRLLPQAAGVYSPELNQYSLTQNTRRRRRGEKQMRGGVADIKATYKTQHSSCLTVSLPLCSQMYKTNKGDFFLRPFRVSVGVSLKTPVWVKLLLSIPLLSPGQAPFKQPVPELGSLPPARPAALWAPPWTLRSSFTYACF